MSAAAFVRSWASTANLEYRSREPKRDALVGGGRGRPGGHGMLDHAPHPASDSLQDQTCRPAPTGDRSRGRSR